LAKLREVLLKDKAGVEIKAAKRILSHHEKVENEYQSKIVELMDEVVLWKMKY
jgi:hypothetical protein